MSNSFEKYGDILFDAFKDNLKSHEIVAKKKEILDEIVNYYDSEISEILFVGFNPGILGYGHVPVYVAEIGLEAQEFLRERWVKFKLVDLNSPSPNKFSVVVAFDEYFTFAINVPALTFDNNDPSPWKKFALAKLPRLAFPDDILPLTVRELNVPTDVMFGCAAVVTVPAVVASPVKAPTNDVLVTLDKPVTVVVVVPSVSVVFPKITLEFANLACARVPFEILLALRLVKLAPLPSNNVALTSATPFILEPVPDIVMSAFAANVNPVSVPTLVMLG